MVLDFFENNCGWCEDDVRNKVSCAFLSVSLFKVVKVVENTYFMYNINCCKNIKKFESKKNKNQNPHSNIRFTNE